jgi:hypothetical protein
MATDTAADRADEAFRNEFLPAMRSLTAAVVEAAKQSRVTADVYARFAHLRELAGSPVVSPENLFGPWREGMEVFIRAVVKWGMVHPNDPIFDGLQL